MPPELMGTTEIAALLGISRQRVLKLAEDAPGNGFPEPLATLTMGKVWDGARVRKFAAGYAPRARRPPGPSPA